MLARALSEKPQPGARPAVGFINNAAGFGPTTSTTLYRGLADLWLFNEGAGTKSSSCINAQNGAFTNTPTWTSGRFGGPAVKFASNAYISYGAARQSDLRGSVVAWIFPTSLTTGNSIFTCYVNDNLIITLVVHTTGRLYIQYYNNGASNDATQGATVLAINTWYQVAVTCDGNGAWALYVNGKAETLSQLVGANTGVWFGQLASTTDFRVGSSSSGLNTPFKGTIDHVRVYSRLLKPAEVLNLYEVPFGDFLTTPKWSISAATLTGTLKTFDGLDRASIKTFNGTAIGSIKTYDGLTP